MAYSIAKKHGNFNRSPHYGSYKYIVVHYTGSGTSKKGAAKANCIYFGGGNRNASAHYFVDDGSIYEYLDPSVYYSWHCGDGKGKYGITNANSIGIEVCINGDNPYTDKEIARVTWLVQYLMKKYNIKASNVVRHYDASRKMCPYYYAKRADKWTALHKKLVGTSTSYKVRITADSLNVRSGAGASYKIVTSVKKGEVFTIIDEKNGWGYLKSGKGWINLRYTELVK